MLKLQPVVYRTGVGLKRVKREGRVEALLSGVLAGGPVEPCLLLFQQHCLSIKLYLSPASFVHAAPTGPGALTGKSLVRRQGGAGEG